MRYSQLVFSLFLIFPKLALGFDCLEQKTLPSLEIKVPSHTISVKQPEKLMNFMHGNVVATMSEEYEIAFEIRQVAGGFCVSAQRITATIGYTNFDVSIDRRHNPDSCEFAAIKEHEYEHINAHLSAVQDSKEEMKKAMSSAVSGVFPVFVSSETEIESAMDKQESEIKNMPQIKLLRQKINADQEIRNKKVDLNDKGERIKACESM